MNRSNWAGNYTYGAAKIHHPETVEQVRKLVSGSPKVRALGSRHSFNDIADTPGDLIALDRFERVLEIDRERHTVTVDASARYGDIAEQIYVAGYALPNLASLPHISVAGACATATHGSGVGNRNLAVSVAALEMVTADGDLVTLSRERDGDEFAGAAVGLGGLGIVTSVTLDLVPAFDMRQDVYDRLPFSQLVAHFDEIASRTYSVSFFTDWSGETVDQVWLKRPIAEGDTFEPQSDLFGATLAPTHRHPIRNLPAEACTPQMGIPGPWYERLPHFRLEFTPSSGEELQTEYLVPRSYAVDALRAMNRLNEQIAPLLQISEVRTIAADDLWMSPCYMQDCVGIHFTWIKDWEGVRQLLPLLEDDLAPLDARPHWGKLFTMPAERVRSLYPRLPDFQRLLRHYDPQGKFRNSFLDTYIFG